MRWMLCFQMVILLGFMPRLGLAFDFERDIAPVLAEHCLDCHGPDEQKAQFRVDRRANLLRGGDSGEPAIVPGKPEASYLLSMVKHEDPDERMPPKGGPLSTQQVAAISTWIKAGAPTPEAYGPDKETGSLTHWSFLPVERPEAESIDELVQARLVKAELDFSPEAERRSLIRRLHLVMTGLPPSPERVETFVGDPQPDAWSRAVDEVLASPAYGERWATHWLDLARFGESGGFETNRERANAWPYRDWVIAAFNDDKPYDDFVREQIAGDAIGEPLGTAFLVSGPADVVRGQDPRLNREQRANELDDMVNTVGTAFLGLTTGCARCHTHKFDPISHKDYHALKAVFDGVRHGEAALPLSANKKAEAEQLRNEITSLVEQLKPFHKKDGLRPPVNAKRNEERFAKHRASHVRFTIHETSRGEPCIDELEIFANGTNVALASVGAVASSGGDFVHPLHKLEHINDGAFGNPKSWIAKQTKGGWVQISFPEPREIDHIVWGRDREGKIADRLPTKYTIESSLKKGEWKALASSDDRQALGGNSEPRYDFTVHDAPKAEKGRSALKRLEAARSELAAISTSRKAYLGTFAKPGPIHRLFRGDIDMPREVVGPDAVEVFGSLGLDLNASDQDRRLALANWIASPDNPLTARVIANRLWQFHFGTGLADTPSDLGRNGAAPTHPELIDWLASELVARDWSLKAMHRLFLHSRTWRQSAAPRSEAMQVDAATRLWWRFPPRRLEAEGIRDAMLAASGVLDLEARGGPGFMPFEVQRENVRHYHAKKSYGPADWRRMVYMTKIRQEREQVFGAFDCPDASMAVSRRSRSTTPLQALNLLNSAFVMQQADLLASRLKKEAPSDRAARVVRAWQLCVQRPPDAVELQESITFIESEGLMQFARAMLNANEFVFIP